MNYLRNVILNLVQNMRLHAKWLLLLLLLIFVLRTPEFDKEWEIIILKWEIRNLEWELQPDQVKELSNLDEVSWDSLVNFYFQHVHESLKDVIIFWLPVFQGMLAIVVVAALIEVCVYLFIHVSLLNDDAQVYASDIWKIRCYITDENPTDKELFDKVLLEFSPVTARRLIDDMRKMDHIKDYDFMVIYDSWNQNKVKSSALADIFVCKQALEKKRKVGVVKYYKRSQKKL